MRSAGSPLVLLLAAGLLAPGCQDRAKTAAQLVLTPDPALAPVATVLKLVRRIDVIVDANQGLHGVTSPGPLQGGGTAVDWDGDGVLEVRFEGPAPESDFPVLEIGIGENSGRELSFRIFGFSTPEEPDLERAAAQGGISATIASGQVVQLGAPFNLTPRARPPQVLMILPEDGARIPGNLGHFTAVLSTTVKPETLAGNLRFVTPGGVRLPTTATVQTATVLGTSFGKEERSILSIHRVSFMEAGVYRLEIGPGIESTSGQRFDQDPRTEPEDAFVSHFTRPGEAGGGHVCEECPPGYLCDDDSPACIPELTCQTGCPTGMVCDVTQAQCVQDCRIYELCLDTSATCDGRTGLCKK
jgi:hypothetical protein